MNFLDLLHKSSNIPKGTEKEKVFGNCRDNTISAIGKILKSHGSLFDSRKYLGFWLNNLPLKYDKP